MPNSTNSEINKSIESANRTLRSAKKLMEDEDYNNSVGLAYYAIFYAAKAALLKSAPDEAEAAGKTHRGLHAKFSKHVVKDGGFDPEMGRYIRKAEQMRQESLYMMETMEKRDSLLAVSWAENFISGVTKYLFLNEPCNVKSKDANMNNDIDKDDDFSP